MAFVAPPPPCGEGMGVGVRVIRTRHFPQHSVPSTTMGPLSTIPLTFPIRRALARAARHAPPLPHSWRGTAGGVTRTCRHRPSTSLPHTLGREPHSTRPPTFPIRRTPAPTTHPTPPLPHRWTEAVREVARTCRHPSSPPLPHTGRREPHSNCPPALPIRRALAPTTRPAPPLPHSWGGTAGGVTRTCRHRPSTSFPPNGRRWQHSTCPPAFPVRRAPAPTARPACPLLAVACS